MARGKASEIKPKTKKEEIEKVETLENTEEKVETVVTRKVTKSDLRRESKNIEIEIINMTSGELFYRCKRSFEELVLMERGDTDVVTLEFLMNMKNQHRTLLERLDLALVEVYHIDYTLDEVLDYLQLSKFYNEERVDTDYIDDLIENADNQDFERVVNGMNDGLLIKVVERGIQLIKQGKFDSYYKRSCLTRKLGNEDILDV